MDIKDVQVGKVELEDAILANIKEFEKTTRCHVADIIPTSVKIEGDAYIWKTVSIRLVVEL